MSKEWYWGRRSSKRGGAADTETPSPGCMCAVFQFFDFHPFHFHINQQDPSFKPSEEHCVSKGAEAPRNSLESEDGIMASVSKEEILKIPQNIKIKTSGSTRSGKAGKYVNDSEIDSSPSAKTPTLVARLMGLDLLPDAQSPSFSLSTRLSTPNAQPNPCLHHLNRPRNHIQTKSRNSTDSCDIVSSRSLPETPRISLARKSDVDYHHRLSLQINKENVDASEEMEISRFSFSKIRKLEEHSSRSPSRYARKIVKQVKESVSRKVGIDITNTVRNREQARERDELVSQYRTNKSPKTSLKVLDETNPRKQSAIPSCSPKLRTTAPSPLAPKDRNSHPVKQPPTSRVLTKPKAQALQQQELHNQKQIAKCKVANEKFSPRLKKPPQTSDIMRNKQEESFVRPQPSTRANDNIETKIKKTHSLPLSSNLFNLNTNLLPVKADPSAATKLPKKESQVSDTRESKCSSQLSSCLRQTYKQQATCILATRESNDEDKSNGASTTGDEEGPEFKYITGMLNRTGVDKGTLVSFTNWFPPTHPLDPSIFPHLEQDPPTISTSTTINDNKSEIFTSKNKLGLCCNQRLLFDLVDELLVEILRPRPWGSWHSYNHNIENIKGSQLIETLWKKVQSFPCAKCEVLEDIDFLIEEEDMPKMKLHDAEAMEEEGGRLVAEIEEDILDKIVHETVMDWCYEAEVCHMGDSRDVLLVGPTRI